MATATKNQRHPGRRKPATDSTKDKHKKLIISAEKKRRDLEKRAEAQVGVLAKRLDTAAADGVETKQMAEWLGISRQMVYKLVRERVDGVPLAKPTAKKPSKNGNKAH